MNRPYSADLSPRELETLRLIAAGQKYAGAAHAIGLSEQTLKNHMHGIYQRLGAVSGPHAIALMDDFRPGWRPRLPFPVVPHG